jgi:histidine ammonia-lyase
MSFLALDGNEQAFSSAAATASANESVTRVAARLRGALAGIDGGGRRAARIQDPYGLRVYAMTEGPLAGAITALELQLTGLVNVAQENPLFDLAGDAVIHHGAFFQAPLALAIDATTLALAQTAPITHSRIRMLNEPDYSGARPFLAEGPAGSSGLMMVEYVAAGAIAELRAAAQPASIGTLVLSRGVEEDASFASQGAVQLERAVDAYRILLACEFVGAMRLLRTKDGGEPASGILRDAITVSSALPPGGVDVDLREDLALAGDLLDQLGQLG